MMQRNISRLFALLSLTIAFLATPSIARAATYYVATTGSDSNPGTQAAPWLLNGRYVESQIQMVKSGSSGKPITFQAQNQWGAVLSSTSGCNPAPLPPSPDLITASLSYNSTTGIFTSVVLNQGTGPTPSGIVIGNGFYVDGNLVTWGIVPGPLAAGASVTIDSSRGGVFTITPGTHTIMVKANDLGCCGRFPESNQTNNTLSQTITVGSPALPDLVTTSLSYNSATGIFTSVVKNQGAAATPAGVVIGNGFYVDGNFVSWGSVPGPLAAGASVTIDSSGGGAYTITPGTHTIMVNADDYGCCGRFPESNKTNNTLSQTISIGGT